MVRAYQAWKMAPITWFHVYEPLRGTSKNRSSAKKYVTKRDDGHSSHIQNKQKTQKYNNISEFGGVNDIIDFRDKDTFTVTRYPRLIHFLLDRPKQKHKIMFPFVLWLCFFFMLGWRIPNNNSDDCIFVFISSIRQNKFSMAKRRKRKREIYVSIPVVGRLTTYSICPV